MEFEDLTDILNGYLSDMTTMRLSMVAPSTSL